VEEFDNGVVAQVELVSTLQVDDSGKRNDAGHSGLAGGEAEGQLTSGGVSHDDELLRIEVVLPGVLSQKLVGTAYVSKGVGPASTFIADTAIFEVCGGQAFDGESGTEVTSVIQVVLRPPEASVDVDDYRVGTF
jgi:hypothetical protein